MSLINDMLHDLEKRRGLEKQDIPAYEAPIINRVTSRGGKSLLLLGAIVLAAGITWAAIFLIPEFLPQPTNTTGVVEPETAKIEPAPAVDEEPALPEQKESFFQAEQVAEPSALAIGPQAAEQEKVGEPLNRMLSGVELSENDTTAKLTLIFSHPPEYQLIQSGDQNRPMILEFNRTQPVGDFQAPSSDGEIIKHFELFPDGEELQLLVHLAQRTQLERLAITEKEETGEGRIFEFSANFLRKKQPKDIVRIKADSPLKIVANATQAPQEPQQQSDEDLDPDPLIEQQSSLTKRANQLSIDRQAYKDGMKMLRRGDLQAADVSFREALRENPIFIEARLQLIDVLLRQGRQDVAMEELRSGLTSVPGDAMLRKKYARFLFDGQSYDEAIVLLRKPPVPEVGKDPEYHALLAALLREAGQFREASEVYARLLQVRPDEPLWWLGLAVSMDQTGETEQARLAYRRAMSLPGLAPHLQNYIQSRLEVL